MAKTIFEEMGGTYVRQGDYFIPCFILHLLKEKGYKQTSLSVQKENYAVNMYRKIGFKVVSETEEEYIMVCELQ